MRLKTAITKKDIVVVLVCLIFLIINVGAISGGGRKRAKRILCLTNLKQLTLAWTQYAEDNDGFIVNGAPLGANGHAIAPTTGEHTNELPWIGVCESPNYGAGELLPPGEQKHAIQEGAMWPYLKSLDIYRCPTGLAGQEVTYAAMDGANGLSRSGQGTKQDVHWMKNITAYRRPHYRIVYIDEGWVTPDSFAVHFTQALWWEDPPVRHGEGSAQSYADGHSEWHRWKGKWTAAYGLATIGIHPKNNYPPGASLPDGTIVPATSADWEDLYWIQRGCWGELGYAP